MIVYTFLTLVASFGNFYNSTSEIGYNDCHIQLQCNQYNLGFGESNQSNPTYTSICDISCDIYTDNLVDQDMIRYHSVDVYNGYCGIINPSEPYSLYNVQTTHYDIENTKHNLTTFRGNFSVSNITFNGTGDGVTFKPTFYVQGVYDELGYSFNTTCTYYSPDDYYNSRNHLNSPYQTFDYTQFVEIFRYRLSNDFDNQPLSYKDGYEKGYEIGTNDGFVNGYNSGYADGYTIASNVDTTINTIFNGILNIGLMPINVFLAMLNFEVLGINVSAFCMSLLTISLTIMVIRMVTGGKDKDE